MPTDIRITFWGRDWRLYFHTVNLKTRPYRIVDMWVGPVRVFFKVPR